MSDPARPYVLGFPGPDDVVPFVDPRYRGNVDSVSWTRLVDYPLNFTIEIIFSLSRKVLASSRYRLFDDGEVKISYVVARGSEWCSTVRFFEFLDESDGTYPFVIDFHQFRAETGLSFAPDVAIHMFFSRQRYSSEAVVCAGTLDAPLACVDLVQNGGPIGSIYEAEYDARAPFAMYTLFLQAAFDELLSRDQIDRLHATLSHAQPPPPLVTASFSSERLKFHQSAGR